MVKAQNDISVSKKYYFRPYKTKETIHSSNMYGFKIYYTSVQDM